MTDCKRHPEGNGPYWCQDCHGVHEIETSEAVEPRYVPKGGKQLQAIGVHGQESPEKILQFCKPKP